EVEQPRGLPATSNRRSASAAAPCLHGVRRYFAARCGPEGSRCDRSSQTFSRTDFPRAQIDTAISGRENGPTFMLTLLVFYSLSAGGGPVEEMDSLDSPAPVAFGHLGQCC